MKSLYNKELVQLVAELTPVDTTGWTADHPELHRDDQRLVVCVQTMTEKFNLIKFFDNHHSLWQYYIQERQRRPATIYRMGPTACDFEAGDQLFLRIHSFSEQTRTDKRRLFLALIIGGLLIALLFNNFGWLVLVLGLLGVIATEFGWLDNMRQLTRQTRQLIESSSNGAQIYIRAYAQWAGNWLTPQLVRRALAEIDQAPQA